MTPEEWNFVNEIRSTISANLAAYVDQMLKSGFSLGEIRDDIRNAAKVAGRD